jgi:hypothetical protein
MPDQGPTVRRTVQFAGADPADAQARREAFEARCFAAGIPWRYVRGAIVLGRGIRLTCEYEFPAGADLGPVAAFFTGAPPAA